METKKRYVRLILSSLNENSNRGQTLWPETDLSRTSPDKNSVRLAWPTITIIEL